MTEELLPNEIYLLVGHGDEGSTIWCDHIPDEQMDAVKYTRSQPKYKRVDLEEAKIHPRPYNDKNVNADVNIYNRAIDDIKSKYGDLYTIERE